MNKEIIEKMKKLAIENGFEIVMKRTPYFDFYHAEKGEVSIHIASLSHNECKVNTYAEFKKEIQKNVGNIA